MSFLRDDPADDRYRCQECQHLFNSDSDFEDVEAVLCPDCSRDSNV